MVREGELFKNADPQALHTKGFRSGVVLGRIENRWSKSAGLRETRLDSSLTEAGTAIHQMVVVGEHKEGKICVSSYIPVTERM